MAIELGQLEQYNAGKGIKFEVGNKAYHINPTLEQGLAFQVAMNERDEKRAELEKALKNPDTPADEITAMEHEYRQRLTFDTYEIVAPLFGSKFYYPTKTKQPKFEGGVLEELRAAGVNSGTIDRLITTMFLSMVNTEDVAMEYMRVGKLDKAITLVQEREKNEAAARATLRSAGETNGTD